MRCEFCLLMLVSLLFCNSLNAQLLNMEQLLEALEHEEYAVQSYAARYLPSQGNRMTKPVFEILVKKNQSPEVREQCVKIFKSEARSESRRAHQPILDHLKVYTPQKYPHVAKELKQIKFALVGIEDSDEKKAIQSLNEVGCEIRRFGNHIHISTKRFIGDRENFQAFTKIKNKIHISIDVGKHHAFFDILKSCNLSTLFVHNYQENTDDKTVLAALQQAFQCKSIEKLYTAGISPDAFPSVEGLPNLREITLPRNSTDRDLAKLGKMTQLEKIRFGEKVTGSGFKDFEVNKRITAFGFTFCKIKRENYKYLKKFPNVGEIGLPQLCSNEDVRLACEALPNLACLFVGNSYVNDQVFESIRKLKHLKYLEIGDSALTSRFLARIDELPSLELCRCSKGFISKAEYEKHKSPKIKFSRSSNPKAFYQPSELDRPLKAIQKLMDQGIDIRPGRAGRKGVMLKLTDTAKVKLKAVQEQLEKIKIDWFGLAKPLTAEDLEVIMQLDENAIIYVESSKIDDAAIAKLKERFAKVVDGRKK